MQVKQRKGQQKYRRNEEVKELTDTEIVSVMSSATVRQKILTLLTEIRQGKQSELELELAYLELTQCQDFSKLQLSILKLQCNKITCLQNLKVPTSLCYLSLGSNNIESIQALQNIQFPELRTFKIYGNKITRVKSLRKCLWPKIQHINLEDNPINDIEMMSMFPKNWKNQIRTQILVCNPYNRLFEKHIARTTPKCHEIKLKIILNFQ